MTYTEQAVELGKEVAKKIALEITPDETIVVIDEFVHTAVDLDMTGKEKFDWVVAKVLELALDVWDLILPLVVQAIYDLMMSKVGTNGDSKTVQV